MSILKRHQSSISGLPEALISLNEAISAEALARATATGDLATLQTEAKDSLVAAINEAVDTAGAGAGSLKTAENLADLADVEVARTNLDVLSTTEVSAAIADAQLAMGSNFTVADLSARDALVGIDGADRVLVKDDGDGKWAIYTPEAVLEGVVQSWVKLYDKDALDNALTAAGIKDAYESNEDTNAFSDADVARLANAVTSDDLVDDLDADLAASDVPTATAVRDLVEQKVGEILHPAIALETLVVADGKITLTNAPINGVAGVLNFGTVRYISGEGIAYDAPVVATGVETEFTISTDTAGQWDGFSVQVQYHHAQ